MPQDSNAKTVAFTAVAVLVMLYGGLLRLDAFVQKYGVLERPAWARVLTHDVAPLADAVRPSTFSWRREPRPYVGGDPINYIKFAREMTWFYQAHVREPVFLALTRFGLWALDGQDAAVSVASIIGSTVAIFAAYLLGSIVWSRPAGLLAAVLMAVEYEAVTWAPDGWRDDTFTATVLLSGWALIRMFKRPSIASASLAGALCGISCLTRITALSFVLPALAWVAVAAAPELRRVRLQSAAVAFAVLALVVAPYLVSCAIVTGDPLIAINYHTGYYRHYEGKPSDQPMTAAEYVRTKIGERPIGAIDTIFNGLFVQPFVTKWNGYGRWIGGVRVPLQAFALAGLAGLLFLPAGRFLLLIVVMSLVPYMLTWNTGDGRAWRFTMHAYPFYIVAAAFAVSGAVRTARSIGARPAAWRPALVGMAKRAAVVTVVIAVGVAAYFGLPWLVIGEAIAHGDSTSVETGRRDVAFFRTGWSAAHKDTITFRVSRGERSTVHIPLPVQRDYDIVLRIDPVDPAVQDRVSVLFNRHLVGLLRLSFDPERVGSYRVRVRGEMVQRSNELTIVPGTLVSAGSAGPRFAWLHHAERVGVRLWYVRVLPLP